MAILTTPLDLTTSAYVKSYANVQKDATDDLIQQLITAASRQILKYIARNPFVANYSETRDGNGNDTLTLWNWPIISVASLTIADQRLWGFPALPVFPLGGANPMPVPASTNAVTPGFVIDSGPDYAAPARICLVGYRFTRGRNNVAIQYQAGYTQTFPESQTIASGTVTLDNQATFIRDLGVSYANGIAFTKGASSLAAGQYTVSATGVYEFNPADNDAEIVITYQFGQVPYDLSEACAEIVAQDLRRRQHIDQDSVVAAQQTTNFSRVAIPRKVQPILDQYRQRMVMA